MTESNDDDPTPSLGLDACTWSDDPDEKRRAFIVNNFPWNPELKTGGQIRAMERIFQWIKTGQVLDKRNTSVKH